MDNDSDIAMLIAVVTDRYGNRGRGGLLALAAMVVPVLLALVHAPAHLGLERACGCAKHAGCAWSSVSEAEASCPICRQLDAYLAQGCLPAAAAVLPNVPPQCDGRAMPACDMPCAAPIYHSCWARPPPA